VKLGCQKDNVKIIILERYVTRVDGERNEIKIVLKILSCAKEIWTLKRKRIKI